MKEQENMNDIKIFEHEKFGKIRVMVIENQEWFVGKDVAEIGMSTLFRTLF